MGVNHRSSLVTVAEQRLDPPDIIIGLQKMDGKAVAERMRSDTVSEFGPADSLVKRILDLSLVQMGVVWFLKESHKICICKKILHYFRKIS
jgi:hypothetical protein